MTPVTAKELYHIFHHVWLHFTADHYDYVKYHGSSPGSDVVLEKYDNCLSIRNSVRKVLSLSKISTKQDAVIYAIACVLANGNGHTNFFHATDDGIDTYFAFRKYWSNPSYHFERDVKILADRDARLKNWLTAASGMPRLIGAYKRNDISIWTVIILNQIYRFMPYWDKKLGVDSLNFVWYDTRHKLIKSSSFVEVQFDKNVRRKFQLLSDTHFTK